MLNFRNLTLSRGGKPLFANANLSIHAGERVGVTGANGCGKSSLFALLRDELHPEAGEVELPPRLRIAWVAQETPAVDRSALDLVLDGDTELRRVEAALEQAHGKALADLYARYDALNGYSARSRAARLLEGLGFATEQLERPMGEFSGGWRMRINLARALMCPSDLLLLDEPTNHLDLDAVLWLEQWLKAYAGTLLLISHDRDFLDSVVGRIIHIEQGEMRLYSGNYSAFEEQRAARLANQQAAFEKQQRTIAHMQRFVERFRAKATKARQAQSRLKALNRMERIQAAHVDSPFEFALREPLRLPNPLLQLDKAAVGYQDTPVLQGVGLSLEPGSRIGLLGRNGAGKSTLIKLLAGDRNVMAGQRREGEGLAVGYFAQHQVEQLRAEWSPLRHLQLRDPDAPEQALRDFLGGFNFRGDKALEPVAPFSGGEKARLVLALLVWQRPNLLLLDEPTNHLDLEMRQALTLALQDFAGALVVVSHDRHLLRSTTDGFLLVADARVRPFDGDLDDYRVWLNEQSRQAFGNGDKAETAGSAVARKERRRQEAEQRNALALRRRPLEKRLQALERNMERLQARQAELEAALADPHIYDEARKPDLKELLLHQSRVERELTESEEAWLMLQEELESLEKA